jgi:hypothetical protein
MLRAQSNGADRRFAGTRVPGHFVQTGPVPARPVPPQRIVVISNPKKASKAEYGDDVAQLVDHYALDRADLCLHHRLQCLPPYRCRSGLLFLLRTGLMEGATGVQACRSF